MFNFSTRLICLLVCVLAALGAQAQPGGGGGLHIIRLFDRQWRQILPSDSALHIRAFALKDGKPYQENFYYRPDYIPDTQYWNPTYLLPQEDFDLHAAGRYPASDQRMMICYGADTMLIDFLGIVGENGAGYRDEIDSVMVMPGHFRYAMGRVPGHYRPLPALVPGAVGRAQGDMVMEYLGRTNTAFLDEANWGADFFLSYAKQLLHKAQYADALVAVDKGMRKAGGARICPALHILSEAYAGLKRYDDALAAMREGIYCGSDLPDGFKRNIDRAVALAWQSGQPAKALAFFDLLARDADSLGVYDKTETELLHDFRPPFQPLYERAMYVAAALQDEPRARRELQAIIDSIPKYYISELVDGSSQYGRVYVGLAGLEYKAGLRDAAYRHWLRGMELQYSRYDDGGNALLFDSLIRADGASAQLYLARALAHVQNPVNRPGYAAALRDLDAAARLESADYRVAMYRARVLAKTGARDSALVCINRAIVQAPDDPRPYLFRYEMEHDGPPAVYEAAWLPDLKAYHERCEKWNFKGYMQ